MVSAVRRGAVASVVIVVLAMLGIAVAVGMEESIHPLWDATPDAARAARDPLMVWLARGLLVLALSWVLIGVIAAHTPLVRRPGAAAARATWLASTRPWRARESTLGMLRLDHWLLLLVPVALLIGTRAIQTSFLSWLHLAIVLGGWVAFALVLRWLLGLVRSPFPVIAAVGGAVVLRCIVDLAVLAVEGPTAAWVDFLATPVFRVVFVGVSFVLFVWVFVAAVGALRVQIGWRRGIGAVTGAIGAGLAAPALAVAIAGIEETLTAWNAQLGLLAGDPAALGVPEATAWIGVGAGSALVVAGVVMALAGGRGPAEPSDFYTI